MATRSSRTSEVEELLDRIAKMRRTTKTAIKDEYEHIERAEYLQDGEFFQLPEGASELRCAPGFYFEPPSEEVQTDRALKGQPPSRGFIWRKPTPKESVPTRICDALFTEARVVLPGSLGPALALEAPQADGTTNRMLLPEADIIRDPRAALASINHELNVKHYTTVERAITAVYPNDSALPGQYVERHGWTDAACTHFALTDMVLGSTDLPIISRVKGHDHREGTLDDWREVAALADGNPAMIFAVSTQFASPTIQLQTVEGNAIINLVAPSSTGKTTVLRAAASVWGRATSPDPTQPEFMTRWRNTSNALESIAASRNGLGLVVDDLGTLSPDEAEAVAYMLGNGVGKGRLTRDVQLRESKKWAFYGLSSGEVTLRDHAQQARFRRSLGAGCGKSVHQHHPH